MTEKEPEFPGGFPGLVEDVTKNVNLKVLNELEDKFTVRYYRIIIDKEGKIAQQCILRVSDESQRLDKLDLRIMDYLQKLAFKPAIHRNKPVFFQYTLPIKITNKAIKKANR